MALDQYRLQPLPPRKKPIWKILAFGMIAILLISAFLFVFMNQRIICEATGGEYYIYPDWIPEFEKRHSGYYHWSFSSVTPEMAETWGKCFR